MNVFINVFFFLSLQREHLVFDVDTEGLPPETAALVEQIKEVGHARSGDKGRGHQV